MSLGSRLIQLRRTYGKSQDEVGEICGVTKSSVSQWESDSTSPDIAKLALLRKKLEFSLDWLISGIGLEPDLAAPIAHTIQVMKLMQPEQQYLAARLVDQVAQPKPSEGNGT